METAGSLAVQFGKVRNAKDAARGRFFENLGKFGFGGLGAVVVIGLCFLIYTIITKFILDGSRVASGVLLTLFIIFASLSFIYVIYNESRKEGRSSRVRDSEENALSVLPAPTTGKFLTDPAHEPVPSVVEHTTELLRSQPRKHKS